MSYPARAGGLVNRIREKQDNMKKVFLFDKRNPIKYQCTETLKIWRNTYQKEQLEFIQGQINKIRNSVKDRQSWLAWQMVNEVSRIKSTLYIEAKSCQPRRKTSEMERTFQESTKKPS